MRDDMWVCLTCGETSVGWGNNPWPINGPQDDATKEQQEELSARVVCGDCNLLYVIPVRLGHKVSGRLYGRDGKIFGHWEMLPEKTDSNT